MLNKTKKNFDIFFNFILNYLKTLQLNKNQQFLLLSNHNDNYKMQQNKKINDQLRVIYHAIGLLPKVNGTYLSNKRDTQPENQQKDALEYKKFNRHLDLQKAKRRLSHQLKKQTLVDEKQKKGINYGGKERSVTEVSKISTGQIAAEAQQQKQQKLHIVKLSEFLKLRTRQMVVFSNYKKCINKLNSKRQKYASNRTLDEKQDKQIDYFFPDGNPLVATKLDAIKIKINKCDVKKLDSVDLQKSQRKRSINEIEKKFSFNEGLRHRQVNKNGRILMQGEKIEKQGNNQTKFNRWEFNESKFRPTKKRYGRVNESWEIEHDEIYL